MRLQPTWMITLVVACGLLWGCQGDTSPTVEPLDPPAGSESGQPHLHADDDGPVWLSWVEPGDTTEHAFRYASFDGRDWSAPQTIAAGDDWFVNWADVPSFQTLPDGRKAAHYLVSSGPDIFAYDVHITQADDDGTWQESITPHQDGTETEHGFASMLPLNDGLLAVWLDGREMADDGPMTLRGATLDASGAVQRKDELDDHVCECCPTSGVHTDDGALFAYRDRTEDEVRNISLVRRTDDGWSDSHTLHDDGWQIEGCPVNGPALDASGDHVVAAWFTGADNRPRVYAAFSDNSGHQFSAPVPIANQAHGRVDVALLDDASAIVSWIGYDENGNAALRLRRIDADGTLESPITVTPIDAGRSSGIPRLARHDDQLYVAWVDTDSDRVQAARLDL